MSQKETTPTINIDLSKDNEIKEGERKETMEKEWKETAREIYWEKSECWKTPSKSKPITWKNHWSKEKGSPDPNCWEAMIGIWG